MILNCDETAYYCRCREPAGHKGPHKCPCGGEWTYDDSREFVAVTIPPFEPIPGLEAWADW